MGFLIIIISILAFSSATFVNGQAAEATKRPIYIIGHMANSINVVEYYLGRGANALESDIQFHQNGTVSEVFHGFPCDCLRYCHRRSDLKFYLAALRALASGANSPYGNQLVFQLLDLKLNKVPLDNLYTAGVDIANHVLVHLWGNSTGGSLIKVVLFIYTTREENVVRGFVETLQSRGKQHLLANVGYDGGLGELSSIRAMFQRLGIQRNIWLGDGVTNCISFVYPDRRLREEIKNRDSSEGFIDKVYHWSIDSPKRMRHSLGLGVDGMITNLPRVLRNVLAEPAFRNNFKVATPEDDPFVRFPPRN